jgi:predicted MFS family arabinose efflux permease
VLGVPAVTWIGQQAGWRTAFLAMAAAGLATVAALTVPLPRSGCRWSCRPPRCSAST